MKKGLIAISNSATISSEGLIVQLLGVLIADVLIMDPHNAHLAISRFMPHAQGLRMNVETQICLKWQVLRHQKRC